MPCNNCHHPYAWSWTEAIDKFGFGDGDGHVYANCRYHWAVVLFRADIGEELS